MQSLSKKKLSEMVADEIINFMITRQLKPHDKLPTEKEISEKLDIGRTSVREGLMKLESIGLLNRQHGYGIFINEVTVESYFQFMMHSPLAEFIKMDREEVLDLLNVRFTLESDACLRAAKTMNEGDFEELNFIYKQMCDSRQDFDKFIELDIQFHGKLINLSGSRIIFFLYSIIGDLLSKQFQITFKNSNLDMILDDHKRIADSIQQKDGDKILDTLNQHFNNVREIIINQFNQNPA